MTSHETDWPLAESIAHAIGPEAGQLGTLDPAGFGAALVKVLGRGLTNGPVSTAAPERFWRGVAAIGPAAAALWQGAQPGPPVPVPDDRRFADPAWRTSPFLFALRQCHAAGGQLMSDPLAAGRGDRHADAKAQLAAGFLLDALAPTNFLPTNPAALKRAIDTGGGSVLAVLRNLISDLVSNNGLPRRGRGGKTGRGGRALAQARWSRRRRSAATATRQSATPPATTSADRRTRLFLDHPGQREGFSLSQNEKSS